MKTAKLVIGILSIVLTMVVLFQSCAATVGDALANEGGTSGGVGMAVALLMLVGRYRSHCGKKQPRRQLILYHCLWFGRCFGTDCTWHFPGFDRLGKFVPDFCTDFPHWFD